MRRLTILLLVMSIVLVACGGDDDASAPTTTAAPTTTVPGVTVDIFRFCDLQKEINALGQSAAGDPEALQAIASGDEFKGLVDDMLAIAPPEVIDDVKLVLGPVEAFAVSGDYDAFLEAAGAPDQVDAQQRMELFLTANCAG